MEVLSVSSLVVGFKLFQFFSSSFFLPGRVHSDGFPRSPGRGDGEGEAAGEELEDDRQEGLRQHPRPRLPHRIGLRCRVGGAKVKLEATNPVIIACKSGSLLHYLELLCNLNAQTSCGKKK